MSAYVRRLSRDDVAHGRLLIEKARWAMFPAPGGSISADVGGRRSRLRLSGESCACVSPVHEHRYLELGSARRRLIFVAGARVVVDRAGGVYRVGNTR